MDAEQLYREANMELINALRFAHLQIEEWRKAEPFDGDLLPMTEVLISALGDAHNCAIIHKAFQIAAKRDVAFAAGRKIGSNGIG